MLLPQLPAYIGEDVFAGWTSDQGIKTYEGCEELYNLLSTGLFKGCEAVIYDKDFNELTIDPKTGLLIGN